MAYELILAPLAEKALDRIPKPTRVRILDAVESLRDDPRPAGVVKLQAEVDLWRIRVGSYRVVYEIRNKRLVVLVLRIGQRKDIYRRR